MAGAFQDEQISTCDLGELPAPVDMLTDIQITVDREGGHVERATHLLHCLPVGDVQVEALLRRGQHLPGGFERPGHRVLVLLGGVRLDQLLAEEELDPVAMPGDVDVAVVQLPATGVFEDLVPIGGGPHPVRLGTSQIGNAGLDGDEGLDPVWMPMSQAHRPPIGMTVGHEHRPPRTGDVEHGEEVVHVLLDRVGGGVGGSARAAVPSPINGDRPIVPGQIGHEPFPDPGMGDR